MKAGDWGVWVVIGATEALVQIRLRGMGKFHRDLAEAFPEALRRHCALDTLEVIAVGRGIVLLPGAPPTAPGRN